MSWLKKVFGGGDEERVSEATRCPHVAMIPRWDQPEDIGKEDRASGFRCEACGELFTPAEARMLREHEAERLASLSR
jgi:hypothetical protein